MTENDGFSVVAATRTVSYTHLDVYKRQFLGIGLQYPATSWGTAINEATQWYQVYPHNLLFPSVFLSLCVLAFMTLGDAVRDAFDPKQR